MSGAGFISFSWLLCILSLPSPSLTMNFSCWPESEQQTLTFANNPTKPITTLPTITLLQGYYSTQWAVQYITYIYLTEQLGLNVTWYPSGNYDILLILNKNKELEPEYPHYYTSWIVENKVDLVMEVWATQAEAIGAKDFYKNGTVYDGGTSGIYGEMGWFIPLYLTEADPNVIVPTNLKNNQTYRNNLINALVNGTDIDWIAEWYNIRGINMSDNDNNGLNDYKFGYPNYDIPTIFGSLDTYLMSEYSYNQTKRIFGDEGLNVTFATFDNEHKLSHFVMRMYEHKLPFIANLYSPHVDFGMIVNETTGETMEFERFAFRRNPSNSASDECYLANTCRQPLFELTKMGNPRLEETFPEMIDFLDTFAMNANQINQVLQYHHELVQIANLTAEMQNINDSSISNYSELTSAEITDIWLNASCIWLKENLEQVRSEWLTDIIRYDCIDGCGFTNYSQYDKDNNEWVIKNYNGYIGGTCDITELDGECICWYDNLVGNNCKESCPGLLGPYWNDTVNNYTFKYCNGNGICDIDTKKCDCDKGFGEDDCSNAYDIFEYDDGFRIFYTVLYVGIIGLYVTSYVWFRIQMKYPTISAMGVYTTTLFTAGMVSFTAGSMVSLFHPISVTSCSVEFYLTGIGASLAIGSSLLKSYRIAMIYQYSLRKLETVIITNTELTKYLSVLLLFEISLCVGYTVFSDYSGGVNKFYNDDHDKQRIEYQCNSSEIIELIEHMNYIFNFFILLIFCYFAVKTRVASKLYKDTSCAYFGSFITLFTFFIIVIFHYVSDDIELLITIQSGAISIVLFVIWVLFYGVRMYRFYLYPNDRDTVTILNRDMTSNRGVDSHVTTTYSSRGRPTKNPQLSSKIGSYKKTSHSNSIGNVYNDNNTNITSKNGEINNNSRMNINRDIEIETVDAYENELNNLPQLGRPGSGNNGNLLSKIGSVSENNINSSPNSLPVSGNVSPMSNRGLGVLSLGADLGLGSTSANDSETEITHTNTEMSEMVLQINYKSSNNNNNNNNNKDIDTPETLPENMKETKI